MGTKIKISTLKQIIKEEVNKLLVEGYTLYWNEKKEFTDNEWKKLIAATKKILATAKQHDIIIAGPNGSGKPIINDKEISLNGDAKNDLNHEPFYLPKKADKDDWGFCKTARKPYDAVVASILAVAKKINPNLKPSGDDGAKSIKMGGTEGWNNQY